MGAHGRTEKYLERHAAPAARERFGDIASAEHFLVVPARDESASLFDGLAAAVAEHDAVVVVVVNGSEDSEPGVHARNQRLLQELPDRIGRARLFAVDAASEGRRLSAVDGVGLARKIGFDLGVELRARGGLRSPWLHTTDADATLPPDYFARAAGAAGVAVHYPFWHEESGDPKLDEATAHYELWLRYQVAGLRSAGAAGAHHAVGSCLAVDADAYVAVRGVPRRRRAGEDFHLLDKLSLEGDVTSLSGAPILLRSRTSSRVPFGTGPGVAQRLAMLAAGQAPTLPDPRVFELLRELLVWSEDPTADPPAEAVRIEGVTGRGRINRVREAAGDPDHRRRIRQIMGALWNVQFMHDAKAAGYPDLAWDLACERAPFAPTGASCLLHDVRAALAKEDGVSLGSTPLGP